MKKSREYGDCHYCGGRVSERRVQKICTRGGRLMAVVDDVPTGVCEQCGERYYKATVLKKVDSLLAHRSRMKNRVSVPLAAYAA